MSNDERLELDSNSDIQIYSVDFIKETVVSNYGEMPVSGWLDSDGEYCSSVNAVSAIVQVASELYLLINLTGFGTPVIH